MSSSALSAWPPNSPHTFSDCGSDLFNENFVWKTKNCSHTCPPPKDHTEVVFSSVFFPKRAQKGQENSSNALPNAVGFVDSSEKTETKVSRKTKYTSSNVFFLHNVQFTHLQFLPCACVYYTLCVRVWRMRIQTIRRVMIKRVVCKWLECSTSAMNIIVR